MQTEFNPKIKLTPDLEIEWNSDVFSDFLTRSIGGGHQIQKLINLLYASSPKAVSLEVISEYLSINVKTAEVVLCRARKAIGAPRYLLKDLLEIQYAKDEGYRLIPRE